MSKIYTINDAKNNNNNNNNNDDEDDIERQRVSEMVSSVGNGIALCCIITSLIILCIVLVFRALTI